MAETPCILGQVYPDAQVETTLFAVGQQHQVQCTIFVANTSESVEQVTIALIPEGTIPGSYNYIAYHTPMIGNACMAFAGVFLNSGDKIKVSSMNGQASFSGTGMLMS